MPRFFKKRLEEVFFKQKLGIAGIISLPKGDAVIVVRKRNTRGYKIIIEGNMV